MSDQDDFDVDDDNIDPATQEVVRQPTPQISRKEAKAQAAELVKVQRELALVKAGIDTDSALGKMFARSYDGEMSADAVKAAWTEIAPAPATPTTDEPAFTTPDPDLSSDATSTAERTALANGGANPDIAPKPDPRVTGEAAFKAAVDAGGTEASALAGFFDTLVGAAIEGDKRVLL